MTLAAWVIETLHEAVPLAETATLILADAALALELAARDLRRTDANLRLACHRAVTRGAAQALAVARGLVQSGDRLRSVAPKLRTKRSDEALVLFLSDDALPATALTPLMSDRAARRFGDRLMTLGALRELTELAPEQRPREWMRRIGAVIFVSARPVARAELALIGQRAAVELMIEDLTADLADRPYEVVRIGAGWMLRTRPAYAAAIHAAALPDQAPDLAASMARCSRRSPITSRSPATGSRRSSVGKSSAT